MNMKHLKLLMIIGLLLSGCSQVQESKETEKGRIVDLNFNELQNKITNKDSFVLQFSKRECPYCIELEKIEDKYLINNDLIIYRYYPQENIEHYQESIEYIQDFFPDLKYVPTVYWIEDGVVEDTMDRVSTNQYQALEEWINKIHN